MGDSRMQVRQLSITEVEDWWQVGEGEIFVSDIIDAAGEPDAEMTVGFARIGRGEELEISFPYDEVLIVTKGAYTVRSSERGTITARAGEVIYLPADSENSSVAEEDTEMVYVAGPPAVYARHVAASAAA